MTPSDKPTDAGMVEEAMDRLRNLSAGNKSWAKHTATPQQAYDLREDAKAIDTVLSALSTSEASRLSVEGDNGRLREALAALVRMRESIETDVKSAHSGRGAGASDWMREDDRDFRIDLEAAFDVADAVLSLPVGAGGKDSSVSQDPGPHPCGEQPGADVAATAALAPEGWVLVPPEISIEMQHAYFDVVDENLRRVSTDPGFGRFDSQQQAYRAMLAAAPRSPLTGEGGE